MSVYGDNDIFIEARNALYSQMNALKTAMDGASTTPRPAAVYTNHDVVKMTLPALSVGVMGLREQQTTQAKIGGANSILLTRYEIICDVRIHLAFEHDHVDLEDLTEIANSVNNWLNTHRDLSASFTGSNISFEDMYVNDVSLDEAFEVSLTEGGRITLTAILIVQHTQL